MTLDDIIADLKAAGANENTVALATTCYTIGSVNERYACIKICEDEYDKCGGVIESVEFIERIEARNKL